MRKLRQILSAYGEADDRLRERQDRARSVRGQERWAKLRDIDDQAYFVMLFACFEDRVNELCERLVRKKQSQRSWRHRRLWDHLKPKELDRVPFKRRTALLIDKGSTHYRTASSLYDTRCQIAHGAPAEVGPLNVPSLYRQIAALWKALRP